ncbi:MAG: glycosyltransferase family 39 protein [Candidatus Coatesbacteria bacterium]|nr:glycosyltransferase family 39 protein [Candidatus Coatesbacteria bacterium]
MLKKDEFSDIIEKYGSAILLIISMIVYLMLFQQYISKSPFSRIPVVDSLNYWVTAVDIAQFNKPFPDFFYNAPLYTMILILFIKIAGSNIIYVYLLQSVIAIMTVLILYELWSIIFTKTHSFIASLLLIFYMPYAFYITKILPEIFAVFFLSVFLLFFYMYRKEKQARFAVLLGFAGGLCILIRSQFILIVAVFEILYLLEKTTYRSKLQMILHKSLPFVLTFISIIPSGYYNYIKTGRFSINAPNGGLTFYMGNNENAQGTYCTIPGISDDLKQQTRDMINYASTYEKRQLSVWDADQFFWKKGMEFIRKKPLKWIKLELKKIILVYSPIETSEIYDMYLEKNRYLGILNIFFLNWGILFPFFVLGVLSVFWGKNRDRLKDSYQLILLAFLLLLPLIVFLVISRFRVLLVPAFLILSSSGLFLIKEWFTRRKYLFLACSLIFFMLQTISILKFKQETPIGALVNLSYILIETGRYDETEIVLKDILKKNPDCLPAVNNLVTAYINQGKFEEAKPLVNYLSRFPQYKKKAEYFNNYLLQNPVPINE